MRGISKIQKFTTKRLEIKLSQKIRPNSKILEKKNNCLETFGVILSHILLYIARLSFKAEVKNLLKEENQNYKINGENSN